MTSSIRLRLRSDVPLGAALSGGLDSSTLVCIVGDLLKETTGKPIKTISSRQQSKQFDEWNYAEIVNKQVNAESYSLFPTTEKLRIDVDRMLWHMDYPFASTSQFSQWCVFEEASRLGLKVMINGQGADEQLAGYAGNEVALFTEYLSNLSLLRMVSELQGYRQFKGAYPFIYIVGALQNLAPAFTRAVLPERFWYVRKNKFPWLKEDSDESAEVPKKLSDFSLTQITKSPLPSLLRYEDRNSMAFSVESRVPFLDFRVVEFLYGLPADMKLNKGRTKYILREAMKGVVPSAILNRADKLGFASDEQNILAISQQSWFFETGLESLDTLENFVDKDVLKKGFADVASGRIPYDTAYWRTILLAKWIKQHS